MDDTPPVQPDQPPEPQQIIAPDTAPITPPLPGAPDITHTEPPQRRKKSKILLPLVLLVIIVVGAGGYAWHHHTSTSSGKKDIPYLSFGTDTTADLRQAYPTEAVDTDTSNEVNAQLFEGLVRYQQGTKIIPLLATSWSNPNNTTWVFNLRHGVTFHSGRTMTAADVKYSLDYVVNHQSDNSGNTNLSLASTIEKVTVVNPYQIKITTDGPDPVLLNRLPYLYIMDSKGHIGDPDAGTGPYIVKPGTKPTANDINLVAYNNYWGGHVYTRAVHVQVVANANQLTTDTKNGQFDLAGDFTNQQLLSLKKYQPISIQDLGITFLGLNTLKAGSPLQSLAARQAAADALNIPAILKAGSLRGTQASQLVPLSIPGHDPSIQNTAYNPVKARALLATVSNKSVPLTLSYTAVDAGQVTEIARELTAVGFNIKAAPVPDLNTLVNMGLGGQTDMFYVAYASSTLDGLDILNSILVGNQDYNNATVNKLANQAGVTLDPATRIALLQKIARQVASDIPDIPLYTQTRTLTLTKPYHFQVDIPSIVPGVYFWQTYQ